MRGQAHETQVDRPSAGAAQETLLLWAIIGAGGEAFQKDLSYEVDAAVRIALEKRGLIQTSKGLRNALMLSVTDAGWAWADQHLDAELPANPTKKRPNGGPYILLHQWLVRLAVFKRHAGVSLAELVGSLVDPGTIAEPDSVGRSTSSLSDVQRMIEQAYRSRMARSPGGACSLRDLRADLPSFSHAIFDQAVLDLVHKQRAVLMRADNNFALTEEDCAAGIRQGGEVRHLLWIEP
jgi:hypothetical protein